MVSYRKVVDSKWRLSTLLEKTSSQCGGWCLEWEIEEDQWQPSPYNFISSHCQSFISFSVLLYPELLSVQDGFFFLFLAFHVLYSVWYKLNTNLMKQWTQLDESSGGGWQVKDIVDGEVTGGGTAWTHICGGGKVGGHFEIKCRNPPWLMLLKKKKKELKSHVPKKKTAEKVMLKVWKQNFLVWVQGPAIFLVCNTKQFFISKNVVFFFQVGSTFTWFKNQNYIKGIRRGVHLSPSVLFSLPPYSLY